MGIDEDSFNEDILYMEWIVEVMILLVNKGTSWVFIGRTDIEEAPILWPPDAKSWLIWKDPDAGKHWG